MNSRGETAITEALVDLANATRTDQAVINRLLEVVAEPPQTNVRRQGHRVWPLLVSSAAVVLGLGVVIALLLHPAPKQPSPPVNSSPTQSTAPAPRPTSTTSVSAASVLQRCVVPMPNSWIKAMTEVPPPPDGEVMGSDSGLTVLAMTPTGDAITYSNVMDQHSAGALVLVHPDGTTRTLYSLQFPLGQPMAQIQTAQTDGRWVVFDLGDFDGGKRSAIKAINLNSGATRDIAAVRAGMELSAPQVLNSTAYWSEVSTDGTSTGHVYGYGLSSGRRSTIDTGSIPQPPAVVGGALQWSRGNATQWLGTPHLPADYPVIAKPYPLVQDGASAAWTDWDQSGTKPLPTVMIKRANQATAQIAYRGTNSDFDVQHQPRPFALTGAYLIYTDGADMLALNLDTGAAVQVQPYDPDFVRAAAAKGVLAIDTLGSKGGSHLALLRPADLPEPHC